LNATINRELIVLKRMCTLAMQAGKLTVRRYIPLLKENKVRKGFFERELDYRHLRRGDHVRGRL
jgi:hypothetical protein